MSTEPSALIRRGAARIATARDEALASPSHDARTTSILGVTLGVSFTICFLTGLLSHLIQHPPQWFHYGARPAGLYRFTQGLHVATGTVAVPLLLAKLWAASPHLVQWPPVRSVAHAVERISIAPLVGGSIFMLWSGLANAAKWYPYPFSFVPAHYTVAWITIGGLVVHIAAKVGIARDALRRGGAEHRTQGTTARGALSRRQFVGATVGGSVVLTLATIGQTFRPLRGLAVLAPRDPTSGPQHVPVNRTAKAAGVLTSSHAEEYRLVVTGRVRHELSFTVAELESMPRHEAVLPIACVEGWSASARWSGVRVRDLLAQAGARPGASVMVASLQQAGAYATSVLEPSHAHDPDTLLALTLNGERLHIDHGYPVRLISPNRPGVMQTKWVRSLEVT